MSKQITSRSPMNGEGEREGRRPSNNGNGGRLEQSGHAPVVEEMRSKIEGEHRGVVAADLMTERPASVKEGATIRQALEMLQRLDVRHLPVVNASNELVGMLSDRDIRALPVVYEEDSGSHVHLDAAVTTLMSADVLSVDPETPAAEIVEIMLDNKIGAVPVVTSDGTLVGIVSYVDFLRELEGAL